MTCNAAVIIPAAGFGTRMNLERPKQFVLLAGLPLSVNVPFLTIMATGMPYVGRG
mgnify:CR=1 FL=1